MMDVVAALVQRVQKLVCRCLNQVRKIPQLIYDLIKTATNTKKLLRWFLLDKKINFLPDFGCNKRWNGKECFCLFTQSFFLLGLLFNTLNGNKKKGKTQGNKKHKSSQFSLSWFHERKVFFWRKRFSEHFSYTFLRILGSAKKRKILNTKRVFRLTKKYVHENILEYIVVLISFFISSSAQYFFFYS